MKEIKFSTANHPDQWWADDYGGVIKFASTSDAKAAEELFTQMKRDRDHAWDAFQRLRRAYSMIRYPTLTQEIKLLYDQADMIAAGKINGAPQGSVPEPVATAEANVGQTTENPAVAPPNERRVAQRRKIVTTYLCNGLPIENAPDSRTIHPADRRQSGQSNE